MKKIAIVSCYFQHNYGSMLQAYATQEILNILNFENETICINGFKEEIQRAKITYFKSRIFSKDVVHDKLGFIRLKIASMLDKSLANSIMVRNKHFDNFFTSNFALSREYTSLEELGRHSLDYSAFIVGSDQLWLPSNISANYYTLSYVQDGVRKISYATSFGVSTLPKTQEEIAKKFLPRIEYLSVREKSGQQLIKKLTGLNAELVCDPTLLLEKKEWDKLIPNEPIIKRPYIFCYFLGNNRLSRECAKKLSRKTGLKIVALQQLDMYIKTDKQFADIAPYDIDPAGFVNLIRNASFVLTDSFHGTVFSIINHKRFFSFRRFVQKTTMSTNSRIDSLLNVLGLDQRIINTESDFKVQLRENIDFSLVDITLENFRKKSMSFLLNALEGLE